MNTPIDLRSDTVTLPTRAMREAMYHAELGDDVYGEDPTVNALEAQAAAMLGHEAALFVVSGTMGNLVAILTHCGRGDEAIMGDECHTFHYEVGGAAALGGVPIRTVPNGHDGLPALADIEAAIRPDDIHDPPTRLLCLENTHNRCGGTAIGPEPFRAACDLAHRHGVAVHLDGARIFNAAIARGCPVRELVAPADTVMFCLSKGLGAPVGSLLAGPADFITRARKNRKMVGGAMRQVGVLAAAGLVALDQMVDRLAEDHEHAQLLAHGLAAIPGVHIDPSRVHTNIVIFEVTDPLAFLQRLQAEGVLGVYFGGQMVRLVTHYGITRADIEATLVTVRQALRAA
ncbi:MAG: low-specificity L-threonine aldolase [Chloroflexi bacterium]|nr:low-specificity L-threonine aldolase [Chloroflexota bacterium]MBU1749865.1 low-specificity L-threonine aldolase [Chloroflexota bacterium]MBU1879638.1 low-specificity L-threonine aldolase [Chloroflexota bacterium]